MKEEALEQLMGAYQATGIFQDGRDRTEGRSTRPQQSQGPCLAGSGKRMTAKTPQDLADAAQYAEKGLQVLPTCPSRKEWQTPIFRSSRPRPV